MKFPPLPRARLLRPYKRFLADVELDSPLAGQTLLTVHCPNTGAMTGCNQPGSRVWLLRSDNPRRKYRYSWELVETSGGHLACIHSARANALVEEALKADALPALAGYECRRREAPIGQHGRRADLLLTGPGRPDCYVEVKSVTLRHDDHGLGVFPDAVSQRASHHLEELMAARAAGHRAVLLFVVQHTGIDRVAPADHIDSEYGIRLRRAAAAGVEVLAHATHVSPAEIELAGPLPVSLTGPVAAPEGGVDAAAVRQRRRALRRRMAWASRSRCSPRSGWR